MCGRGDVVCDLRVSVVALWVFGRNSPETAVGAAS